MALLALPACKSISRWTALLASSCLLSACLGGSIAQQIASSIITNAADKVAEQASNAYDAYQLKAEQESRNIKLDDKAPDAYWNSFVTSGFSSSTQLSNELSATADPALANRAKWQWATEESLPASYAEETEADTRPESSHLVKVEVWNLLIGTEKISALQKAQKLGSTQLPSESDWARWQVATGALESDRKTAITFLIPPSYGKLISGEQAYVEIAEVGGLHIARYPGN